MINVGDVGKRINILRKASNLTHDMIAEYLSLDQNIIAEMEMGERNITSDVIEKLSALFCCTVPSLLLGEQDDHKCIVLFRDNKLTIQDFKVLATINRIALNQFEMDKLL